MGIKRSFTKEFAESDRVRGINPIDELKAARGLVRDAWQHEDAETQKRLGETSRAISEKFSEHEYSPEQMAALFRNGAPSSNPFDQVLMYLAHEQAAQGQRLPRKLNKLLDEVNQVMVRFDKGEITQDFAERFPQNRVATMAV